MDAGNLLPWVRFPTKIFVLVAYTINYVTARPVAGQACPVGVFSLLRIVDSGGSGT
jgi:hypothetical protein